MLRLCFLIFATIVAVEGQCLLNELPKVNGLCSAEAFCIGTTANLKVLVNSKWACINHQTHYNNYRYRYEYDSDYYINLYVRNVLDDYLIGITDLKTKIETLVVQKGNLVSLGITLNNFPKLTKFSLTFNNVETINLRQLLGDSIKTINVSHNRISNIEIDVAGGTVSSTVTTIDLSYNALESIPNNCFAMFSRLQYLDLSFNKLKQFDILTFEGITQLETLLLSNNKISEIGQNFARFMNLKHLTLDNNQITSLTELNFRNLVSLEKLNISSNFIKHIEDQSLAKLTNLEQLDLSHNKINAIHQTLFQNNIKMYKLSLSYNDIENIEGGAFRLTNISYFAIENNYISGSIDHDTFLGISVESLDLSNGSLKNLGDKAFSGLSSDLRYLNLSTNLIENITESAFQSLGILSILDLSCNNLINIDYNTSDLIQLTKYYLQNNKIEKVTSKMFKNLTNLVKLDLSQNKIKDIELNSFIELTNLKELNISSNYFVKYLTMNIFQGLNRVNTLDLSNTRLMSCLNESFSGMGSLNYLNLSHSQLETIEYDTFKETGAIIVIDLSYNMLESFNINTSDISQLSELYLNHNKLKNITSVSFTNLNLLEKLNLSCNNIVYIDSRGLRSLTHLRNLELFSNNNLNFKGDVFNNLVLSQVSLNNVRQQFSFETVKNSSIMTLILSSCEIEDINSVFVYKIRNVLKLDVSSNKIKALNKGSFQNMEALNWLDVSLNMISTIQPGTFLSNKMINTLNLYGNNLQTLQFGVLDGLVNLHVLNLSNNAIDSFGVNLLHNSPNLNKLFLENNNLVRMDFRALSITSVKLLNIGGNSISCDALADWKKINNDSLNVTANILDFNTENIYGISCKGKTNSLQKNTQNKIENTNLNITSDVIEIKEIVRQLSSYLKISSNETFSKIIAILENIPDIKNSDNFTANFNRFQISFNEQLTHLLNKNIIQSDNVVNDIKIMISLLEKNNNLTELGNIQKELLQIPISDRTMETHKNSTPSVSKLYVGETHEIKLDKSTLADIKVLLYFIAVCLAIIILFRVVAITYKYFYRQASHRLHVNHNMYDSGQSMRNGLEME